LSSGLKSFEAPDADHEPFPTLELAFKDVPAEAGFNIELKWDMEFIDGTRECGDSGSFEMNLFVDTILKVVLAYSGARKVIFSSFNPGKLFLLIVMVIDHGCFLLPDLCTMLRMKQNRYPVLFLTQTISTKYGKYSDPRCWDVANGIAFARATELLGLNVIAENLLSQPSVVSKVREASLVLFCWTDDKNDRETLDKLRAMRLDGIVYDRIDMNCSKEIKESVFLMEDDETEGQDINFPSNCSTCSCPSVGSTSSVTGCEEDEKMDLLAPPTTTKDHGKKEKLPASNGGSQSSKLLPMAVYNTA